MNEAPIDAWTGVHALAGGLAGALGAPWPLAVGGLVAYELAEYAIESPRGSRWFGSKRPESGVNVAVDLAVGLGAYALGRWLSPWGARRPRRRGRRAGARARPRARRRP